MILAGLLFFFSGLAAVLDQVIWQRLLGIVSGVHVYSVTMIVTAFMAGLGLGSLLAGRWADARSARTSVLAFAACEALIGAFALASPWLYYGFAYGRLGFLVRYQAALPFLHFALLLFPTFLMGASLPLLARGLVTGTRGAARTLATLYGLNTLGAGVGAFLGVWSLIGWLGFEGSLRVGACLNFVAALGVLLVARSVSAHPPAEHEPAPVIPSPGAPGLRGWAWVYGLSGFVALSLEILWFRTLDVAIKASPYTFGHLLGTFLVCLGLGSLLGTLFVERAARPDRVFFWGQWAVTAWAGLPLWGLTRGPLELPVLRRLYHYWGLEKGPALPDVLLALAGGPGARGTARQLGQALLTYGVLPLWLLAGPALLMGFTYAYIQKAVQTRVGEVGFRVGLIQAANILGCALGSLLTGTLLLDHLGTVHSFRLLLVSGCVFALLASRTGTSQRRSSAAALLSLGLAVALPAPEAFWARLHGDTAERLVIEEDATAVVTISGDSGGSPLMTVNGLGHSRLPYGGAHTLLGVIPTLVHPAVREALIIGLGLGNTAWAAASAEHVARIDVYEIARPEWRALKRFVSRAPAGPLRCADALFQDPRVSVHFGDGRLALRATERRYDLIEADALEVTMAHSGDLYSTEFFELCRSRLLPGGLLCTYVPSERTRRSVLRAFPHLLEFRLKGAAGFMIGGNEPMRFDRNAFLARIREPRLLAYFARAGVEREVLKLLEDYVAGVTVTEISGARRAELAAGEFNSDLFPRDEFDKTLRP